MMMRRMLVVLLGTALGLSAPVMAEVQSNTSAQSGPETQPPRPPRPEIQPPRPGRPEIQPPRPVPPRPGRPEIQPPRPPHPEPPRPPRPEPPRPPVPMHRLSLYPLHLGLGRATVLTSDVRNLARFGGNDRALSLVAVGRWQVCSEARYRGRCRTVSGRVNNLSRIGLARSISSARFLGR